MRRVAALPWRLVRRGALLLLASTAAYVVLEVVSYERTYPDQASRQGLAELADSAAVRALQGVPRGVETTGGFVAWDAGWFLAVVIGVWAVLTTTRLLRGEEDSGRADLVLSRPIPATRLLRAQLAVVAAVCCAFGTTVALSLVLLGVEGTGSLLFGAGLAGFGLTMTAVAAVAAQLLDLRRRAVAAGLAVLGLSFIARMQANSSASWEGLLHATPLGWLDRLEPFAAQRWLGLLPLAVAVLLLVPLSIAERARRDAGAARWSGRERRSARLRLLGGPVAFGWRSTRGVLVSWSLGVLLFGLVLGSMVSAVVDLVEGDDDYARTLEQMGMDLSSPAEGFVAIMAVALALVFALYASWRVGALRAEEAGGRLEHLLVRPVSRWRWLAGSYALTVVATGLVVLAGVVGLWVGARIGGAPFGLQDAAVPLLATLPVAALFGGIAVLAFGAAPRLTVVLPVSLAVLAYLLDLLGVVLSLPRWVLDLSPYAWLPRPPLEPWAAGPSLVLTALGLLAAAVGVLAFARRDLQPD